MDTPINVFGLLPPIEQMPAVTEQIIAVYEAALDAVIEGNWGAAIKLLGKIPDQDGPKRFLLRQMADTKNIPPSGWDGAFSLANK
jgi:hypothetical protein